MARAKNPNNDNPVVGNPDSNNPVVGNPNSDNPVDDNNGLPFKVVDGIVSIVCEKRAGKTIVATTGEKIVFDKNGNADVLFDDALYFQHFTDVKFK